MHGGDAAKTDGDGERQRQRYQSKQQRARHCVHDEIHDRRMEAEGLAEIAAQGADEERAQLLQQRSVGAEIMAVLLDYFRTGEDGRPDLGRIAGRQAQHNEHGDRDRHDHDDRLQNSSQRERRHTTLTSGYEPTDPIGRSMT